MYPATRTPKISVGACKNALAGRQTMGRAKPPSAAGAEFRASPYGVRIIAKSQTHTLHIPRNGDRPSSGTPAKYVI